MSSAERSKPDEPDDIVTRSEREQFFKVQRWFRLLIAAVVLLWLILIWWGLFKADIEDANALQLEAGANLTLVLAPVLVAAAAVERTLVVMFNVIEGSWPTMVAYLGRGFRWQKSAETEVKQARQYLADVSNWYDVEIQRMQIGRTSISELTEMQARMDSANRMMALAQMRLTDAERSLAEASSYESYVRVKGTAWIVIGLMFGVIIAVMGQLQIFALLGIAAVPARFDVLITGLIVGSLSNPVHLLFDILQQGRDVLESIKGYFNRSAPSVQAITQRITTVQSPTAPGKPAHVQPALIETTTAKTTDEEPKG